MRHGSLGYEDIGVLNFDGVYPSFTLPVFSKDDKKYIGILDESGIRYAGFSEVPEELSDRIRIYKDFPNQRFSAIWSDYYIGDEVIVCFCLDENTVGVLTVNSMLDYFDTHEDINIDDGFKYEIDETVKELKKGKEYLKSLITRET